MDFFGGNQGGGPGGLFAQLAQGLGGGPAPRLGRTPARSYDEYFRAYSVAMMPGKQRDNLSYGGKIIMPPSALSNLTNLDLESPWMFQLRNPSNSAASTHAGVLEFIAEEGTVNLPYWMMQTLRLSEGDPIRITGTELPKGKFVKLQAQQVHFLEVSDHKAVLEHALRNFSALTQGDIIEISYNSIVFGFLIMETNPGGEGISILDTDLEVDFAAPVGYVEPERPKAPPPTTMASRFKIDLDSASPGSSRPGSSMAGGFVGAPNAANVSKGGGQWESFKGRGETLAGRKTKGKGISHRAAEPMAEGSGVTRTDQNRIISTDMLEADAKVPAALNLPFGQLFFGFKVLPYESPNGAPGSPNPPVQDVPSFSGVGNTLTGRPAPPLPSTKGKEKEKEKEKEKDASWGSGGQTLGGSRPPVNNRNRPDLSPGPVGAGGARAPRLPQRGPPKTQKERSPSPEDVEEEEEEEEEEHDWGVDDDDDAIMIDSD